MSACADKDILPDENIADPPFENQGNVLSFMVTLDKLGDEGEGEDNPMETVENYVDPEKFRVLFFDYNDKFLFESKSRWVYLLDKTADHETWKVSVPLFSYGNDFPYDWDWPGVKAAITSKNFKVAILANRPELDWKPEMKNTKENSACWFDNTGPHWDRSDMGKKDIFDLHHAQYDPVYEGKALSISDKDSYYDWYLGSEKGNDYMGSSLASWVTWNTRGYPFTDADDKTTWYGGTSKQEVYQSRQPDFNYPIPMYGVQEYAPLDYWEEGTTFDLTRGDEDRGEGDYYDKPVSLLRSVVKLELCIPDTYAQPQCALLWYPNIYSRCEPMNTWTPTDQLWRPHNDNEADGIWDPTQNCEWQALINHGPVSTGDGSGYIDQTKDQYQKKISWFYGIWKKAGKWKFTDNKGVEHVNEIEDEVPSVIPYPQIYNPCIQRNTAIDINRTYMGTWGGYHHYFIYTGERSINDPTNLSRIGDPGGGNSPIQFFMVNVGDKLYAFPICDFRDLNSSNNDMIYRSYWEGPDRDIPHSSSKITCALGQDNTGYEAKVITQNPNYPMPWPLLRNHHYKVTLTATKGDEDNISFSSEVKRSKTLNFSIQKYRKLQNSSTAKPSETLVRK